MAIRPTDIQGSIWQASQTAPLAQRAEEAPRAAQQAAQASFAAHLAEREERVAGTDHVLGNRIDPDSQGNGGADTYEPQERRAQHAFENVVDEASGLDEPPHLIDVTA